MIASIIFCASIIIGVLSITGMGVKITSLILSGSGGFLWPSLLLTALACLVLGMEVPTTAAYVICISVAGPALIQQGLEPLQAHLFVFWFALLSTITPPVCGAVFIAAGMIGENWIKVALTAMALGVGLYVIPLGMIANPDILRLLDAPLAALIAFLRMAVGQTGRWLCWTRNCHVRSDCLNELRLLQIKMGFPQPPFRSHSPAHPLWSGTHRRLSTPF